MLMMAKMSPMLAGGEAGLVFPEVTLTSVYLYGSQYGYAAPGGYVDTNEGGVTGGSLSNTLLPGFVTTDVFGSGSAVTVVFSGDALAALAGVTKLKVNGVEHALDTPYLDGGYTITYTTTAGLSAGTYTVQLA